MYVSECLVNGWTDSQHYWGKVSAYCSWVLPQEDVYGRF